MDRFLFLVVCSLVLVLPVHAVDVTEGDVIDGIVSDPGAAAPAIVEATEETTVEDQEALEGISTFAVSGGLSGGYYFVCDCALGSDLIFYVPNEWAHDALTFDGSGDVVNLSTSTCYLYCPDYPDYTFSASRFGTFSYRASNYNTTDLNITEVTESNISFFEDAGTQMSDTDILILIAALIFLFGAAFLILRR